VTSGLSQVVASGACLSSVAFLSYASRPDIG